MAFEGIRLARERPKAVLIWALVFFISSLITGGILVGMAGEGLSELAAMQGDSPSADPEEALRVFGAIAPAFLLMLPILLAVYGLIYAAVNRAVLQPAEGGPGLLRLGGDEARQVAVMLLLGLVLLFTYVVLTVVVALIAAAVGGAGGEGVAGLLAFVGIGLSLILMLFLGVRLSLASPMTFTERRVRVLQSWGLTRGRFWPLLGGYVLAIALMLVIYLLGMVVFGGVAAVVGGSLEAAGAAFSPDTSSLGAYFTPITIAYVAFSALMTALTTAISVGAAAEAYRQITNGGAAQAAPITREAGADI